MSDNSTKFEIYNFIDDAELFGYCQELKDLINQNNLIHEFVSDPDNGENNVDTGTTISITTPTTLALGSGNVTLTTIDPATNPLPDLDYNDFNTQVKLVCYKIMDCDNFKKRFNLHNGGFSESITIVNATWYQEYKEKEFQATEEAIQQRIDEEVKKTLAGILGTDPNNQNSSNNQQPNEPEPEPEISFEDQLKMNSYTIGFHNKLKYKNHYISIIMIKDGFGNIIGRLFFDNIQYEYWYQFTTFDYLVNVVNFMPYKFITDAQNFTKYIQLPDNRKMTGIDKYEIYNCLYIENLKLYVFGKYTNYLDLDNKRIILSYLHGYIPGLHGFNNNGDNVTFLTPLINHIFVINNRFGDFKKDGKYPVVKFEQPNLYNTDIDYVFKEL